MVSKDIEIRKVEFVTKTQFLSMLRLVETAMRNRPASRAGVGLQTAVSVADRKYIKDNLIFYWIKGLST